MGQGASYFTEEEQGDLMEQTGFTLKELREVQLRYSKLDKSQSTKETFGVSVDDMMKIPELTACPLSHFIAEKLAGSDQTFYPKEAVLFFSHLSSHRSPEEKVEFLFDVLDVKRLGYLSGIEMFRFYHALFSPGLNDDQIKGMTENLLSQTGGKISLDRLKEIIPQWEIAEKLTVDLQIRN